MLRHPGFQPVGCRPKCGRNLLVVGGCQGCREVSSDTGHVCSTFWLASVPQLQSLDRFFVSWKSILYLGSNQHGLAHQTGLNHSYTFGIILVDCYQKRHVHWAIDTRLQLHTSAYIPRKLQKRSPCRDLGRGPGKAVSPAHDGTGLIN